MGENHEPNPRGAGDDDETTGADPGRAIAAANTGIRILLERDDAGPPWRYRGQVTSRDAEHEVAATIAEDGIVTVSSTSEAEMRSRLEKVRLLLRTIHRQASADGIAPPRRVLRWRDA